MHKLLFDNNLSHRILKNINTLFPDSTHVMLENLDESTDLDIWKFAKKNQFTIVTKDSDFNDLVVYKGIPPKVIWLKVGNCKVDEIVKILTTHQESIKEFLNDSSSGILEI